MKLTIQSRPFELTAALDAYIRSKLSNALSRVAPPQTEINIALSDINGPRGGEDKQCKLFFALPGVGLFVIKDTKADLYHAIDSAAQRARHAVSRATTRRRKLKSRRGKPAPDYVVGLDDSAQATIA
jgi:putative sigma-54 modulation protein